MGEKKLTKNGHPHGHRLGHPYGRCPLSCLHAQWMESYYATRQIALERLEAETALYPGDMEVYLQENPLPTLKEFMCARATM